MKKINTLLAILIVIFASTGCNKEREIEETIKEIRLVASANSADIGDIVTFQVFANNKEITNSCNLYFEENLNKGYVLDGSYKFTKNGEYKFFAQHGRLTSQYVIIRTKNYVDLLPEDSEPDNFNFIEFPRKILAINHTSVDCGYAPHLNKLIEDFKGDNLSKNIFFIKAIDFGGKLESSSTNTHIDNMLYNMSHPSLSINLGQRKLDSELDPITFDWLRMAVINEMNRNTYTNIAVGSSYDKETKTIDVKCNVKFALKSNYRIGVLLLEDGIECVQQDDTGLNSDGSMNIHNNVIRGSSVSPDIITQFDNNKKVYNEGEIATYSCKIRIGKFDQYNDITINNIDKTKLLIFTTISGVIDNVVVCRIGEQVGFRYTDGTYN